MITRLQMTFYPKRHLNYPQMGVSVNTDDGYTISVSKRIHPDLDDEIIREFMSSFEKKLLQHIRKHKKHKKHKESK